MKEKFILFVGLCLIFIILTLSLSFLKRGSTSKSFYLKPQNSSLLLKKLIKKDEPVTLIAIGDVMLGRSVNAKMRGLSDFTYPFLKTGEFLRSADITFINLESPFYQDCSTTSEGMIFCADPRALEGLVFSGVDITNLANNHIKNYGQKGVEKTKNLLLFSSITPLGPENDLVAKEIKGIKFGFLGFDLTSGYEKEGIIENVMRAKPTVDILVISFHWGQEYAQKPSSWQIDLAHQVADNGANLILGHHPHVIQETETYRDVPIVYSLGNFIFDQPWSEETKRGLVGIFTFQDKKLTKTEFRQIYIRDYCQPGFEN